MNANEYQIAESPKKQRNKMGLNYVVNPSICRRHTRGMVKGDTTEQETKVRKQVSTIRSCLGLATAGWPGRARAGRRGSRRRRVSKASGGCEMTAQVRMTAVIVVEQTMLFNYDVQ